MPTSKLSTLSSDPPTYALAKMVETEDYKGLLDHLLAVIHRDGGHYTVLTGYGVSMVDAMGIVVNTRLDLRDLKEKVRRLL
jgi:23S rRNA G2069 N7-methylase RlmK/C1962 C5-methylase RlmI